MSCVSIMQFGQNDDAIKIVTDSYYHIKTIKEISKIRNITITTRCFTELYIFLLNITKAYTRNVQKVYKLMFSHNSLEKI